MGTYLFVFVVALLAGMLSGLVGTGSSLILLPVLVRAFGPKAAIPVMALAAIMGNLSRMGVWWRQVDWRATVAYAVPGIPAAALGAHFLLGMRAWVIDLMLGLFFLCMIPGKRYLARARARLSLWQLGVCGGGIGFMTGLVLSTGPLSVPVFIAYGLQGGAFLGTEAASSVLLYSSKISTFAVQGALSLPTVLEGLLVGAGIAAGTAISKRWVMRMRPGTFERLIELLLLVSGGMLLRSAWLSA